MIKNFFATALMLATMSASMSATSFIGYSDGTVGRNTIFRTSTDNTGLAVKIPAEKLRVLAGKKITALDIAVGSKRTADGKMKVFISESLGGEPLVSGEFEIASANNWETYSFATPYEIKGDEKSLYIGYEMDIPNTYQPLSADMSSPMEGVTYALFGTEWRDICEMAVGQGNIRAQLDSDPGLTDLMVKPMKLDGYYKEENPYSFKCELFNFGTKKVDNFKVSLKIGTAEPQLYDINESVEPGKSYMFTIPDYTAHEIGNLDVKLEITEVNGASDGEPSDNLAENTAFFYPSDMERSLLLETFTGQECSQCPGGHRTIDGVVEAWSKVQENPEIITVTHHSGFQPDLFTMTEDAEYTCFYGGGTFAPAAMVNRMRSNYKNVPIVDVSESLLNEILNTANASKPYVALKVASTFDPATRRLDVSVQTNTFEEIPEEERVINVLLCQNNIIGTQSGMGSDYVHNHVFRGALTENAWGVLVPLKPGEMDEYKVSYVIPEKIHSSYYDEAIKKYDIPAEPEDMYIVAYVSAYDKNDINKRYVLNCAKVNLGETKEQNGFASSGIDEMSAEVEKPAISIVDGKVIVSEGCRAIEVYNMAGMRQDNYGLADGLYVVRVITADGNVHTAKVLAR